MVSPNYPQEIEDVRMGDPAFDCFVYAIAARMRQYDSFNRSQMREFDAFRMTINDFLKRHCGFNLNWLIKKAALNNFRTAGYEYCSSEEKPLLFEYRAGLMITALADCEGVGHDVKSILSFSASRIIPYVKPSENEPTFNAILDAITNKFPMP